MKLINVLGLMLILSACGGPTLKDYENTTQMAMTQKINEIATKHHWKHTANVENVSLIQDHENVYQGQATITYAGDKGTFGISVVTDGKKLQWKFVRPEEIMLFIEPHLLTE